VSKGLGHLQPAENSSFSVRVGLGEAGCGTRKLDVGHIDTTRDVKDHPTAIALTWRPRLVPRAEFAFTCQWRDGQVASQEIGVACGRIVREENREV
jgi:hypothetical protein